MDINTCFETTKDYHVISLYSHLIPAAIAIFVGIFVRCKSDSLPVKTFAVFAASFALWLLGDVFLWTSTDYNLVSFLWAPLDYINILFYLLGAYSLVVLVQGKDVSPIVKFLIIVLTFPAWWITVSNQSIVAFDQAVCEALNSNFLTNYKLFIEYIVIAFIILYAFFEGRKRVGIERRKLVTVAMALLLFFVIFSVTEYISSTTGIYEINLYGLFVLPIFLFIIVYAISDLEVFNVRLLGFQVLPYVLIIMVGSQYFFLEDSTYKILTLITFILSLGFSVLFLRSGKRELDAHNKVEVLAGELKQSNLQLRESDRQKDELLGIVSHQLATPISALKWDFEMLLDGDIGEIKEEQKDFFQKLQGVTAHLSDLVSMILDVSRIQLGRMKVDRTDIDLNIFFGDVLNIMEAKAKERKVHLSASVQENMGTGNLDKRLMLMITENLLSNAIKYTPEGWKVKLDVKIENHILKFSVSDTGCGIPKQDQDKIFGKLFRASNVRSVDGNGFGLYVVKGAAEAQGGTISFKSTEGKGTTFFVEIPLLEKKE